MAAKSMITDLEARRTWMLFGDPTLFGAPGPGPVTDGGVTDTMVPMVPVPQDGGVEDGGPADGGAPPMTLDAATNPAPSDGGAPPADAAATTDAAAPPTSMGDGGCGCRAGGSTPASALGLLLVGLALVARRARPRGARRWPLALLALVTALGALAAPRTAHAVYAYRKALTIDRNRIGAAGGATTLTNYPLLISMTDANLKTTANSGHVENANGYDITFTGADTTTCGGPSTCTFNYEIEKYVATTGELVAWVQIPVLKTVTNTANTVIYIKYGDNTISSPTQNVNGTWDTSYKGVWHLNQSPGGTAPQMTDSTSTGGHATATNGPTANSTAKIGAGVTLDGTDDYFAFNSSTAFDFTSAETFTMSGWFQTSDSYGPLQSFRGSVNGNPVIDIHVGYDGATTDAGKLLVLVRDDSSGAGYAQVNGGTVANGSWHMYTVTRSAGTISVYLDGAFVTSATGAGAAAAITTNLRNWGRDGNWAAANYGTADQRFLAASIDEMRVSKTIRAAAWIATDYATQNAPGSTFSASGEALASCGDGTKLMAEGCDDGNIFDGDGCSSGCAAESGYTCNGASPTVCSTTCGDGIVAGAEACDDNGTMNGDGCSSACAVEVAYSCSGSPSVCLFARFDYTKTITVDRTKVGASGAATTLSNYPVLVSVTDANLKSTANGGHVRSASGYDIVFRSFTPATCGGATVCTFAHEVESYDPVNGVLLAWVQVPALNTQSAGSDTTFGIYYGNQAIAASTERRTTTWGSTFTGVWHLNQDPGGSAPQMSDATSNGNNGTANTLSAVSSAVMGAGVSTNGTSSSMSFNSGTSLNSASGGAFTYSAWVKVPVAETAGAIVSSRESTGGGGVVIDLMVGLNGSTTDAGKLMALVRDDSNGTFAQVVGPAINDNAWHLVTLTRSNTTIELFMDATSRGTNTNAGAGGSFTTNLRDLGREGRWIQDNHLPPSTNAFLQATFDEFRASNVARDIHWVTTDYNNQSAPSTFLSFGSETATTGSTVAMLASFAASETCAGTAVRWQTTYEVDTLGFNVYRVVGSQREQLNAALIPAAALSGGGARNYQLVDTGSFDPARTYWLETIHFTAENDLRGPATPSAALACEPAQQRPAPTPLTPAGPSATGDEPDLAAGGCSLAGGSGNALALLAALAFLVRARRRR
jgi:cysteine-rich repeat protein